jgi:hypothetical protein
MGSRDRKSPAKFLTYFQLLDAFREAGCPVCSIVEQGALKALDGVMYEQVNDPVTRERLVQSHGFCNWHAWLLPRIPSSALGAALIYRHLLQNTLDRLPVPRQAVNSDTSNSTLRHRVLRGRTKPPAFLDWRRKKAPCCLCKMTQRAERDALTAVLDFVGEPEFSEAFARSGGLCLPHLALSLEMGTDHPNNVLVLSAHRARWEDLRWELDEFVRKFDYRYADEARGREETSWSRALETLVGRAGIFGPDRGREASEPPVARGVAPDDRAQGADHARQDGPQPVEHFRFENEKLRRRVDDLLAQREEDRQVRLALEFQVCALTLELKAARLGLDAGAPAEAASPRGTRDRPAGPGGSDDRRAGDAVIVDEAAER